MERCPDCDATRIEAETCRHPSCNFEGLTEIFFNGNQNKKDKLNMPGVSGEIKFSMDDETKAALQRFGEKLEHFEYILNKLATVTEKLTTDLHKELENIDKTIDRLEKRSGVKWDQRI